MSSVFLPWTTRGLTYDSRQYLASITMDLDESSRAALPNQLRGLLHPDLPFTDALPVMQHLRHKVMGMGPGIEYGCFDRDGTLIEDPSMRFRRQNRNILYYTLRELFNLRRSQSPHTPSVLLGVADPVPQSPQGNWGVLLSEACPQKERIELALQPLVEHRLGIIVTMPKLEPPAFIQQWLQKRFNTNQLPPYLLICDSFDNIPLEYQFLLNAFTVTGRLWFDDPELYQVYVQKVLAVERGAYQTGTRFVVASPVDDDVTYADYNNIIKSLLALPADQSLPLEAVLESGFNEQSLLESAATARFLAIYCHGVGLSQDDWRKKPDLQGALVLKFESTSDEGLMTPNDISEKPFVPGGIVFTPACLAGGTMSNSDFAAWIDPDRLAPYLGPETNMSAICRAMLSSPQGPIGVLAHFDISMASSAPMYNTMTQKYDLQKMLHTRFVSHLAEGWTLGRATKPFRWASGTYYAQAIYIFGQMTGIHPYIGTSGTRKTIGQAINSMNQYHVIATDMRNYIILGDPAVRVPQ